MPSRLRRGASPGHMHFGRETRFCVAEASHRFLHSLATPRFLLLLFQLSYYPAAYLREDLTISVLQAMVDLQYLQSGLPSSQHLCQTRMYLVFRAGPFTSKMESMRL